MRLLYTCLSIFTFYKADMTITEMDYAYDNYYILHQKQFIYFVSKIFKNINITILKIQFPLFPFPRDKSKLLTCYALVKTLSYLMWHSSEPRFLFIKSNKCKYVLETFLHVGMLTAVLVIRDHRLKIGSSQFMHSGTATLHFYHILMSYL